MYQAHQWPLNRKEDIMPGVGKKKFSYTPKGMAQAKSYAKKTGKKVKYGKRKTK
jgi:hypothetical protein